MLRRLRWSRVIFTMLFIAIILFGASYFIVKQSLAVVQNEAPSEPETITNTEEAPLSEYPGLNLRIETSESAKYTTSISIPVTENEQLNNPIASWITKQKSNFFAEVEKNNSSLNEDNRAHLNIQLKTEKVTDHIYSLLFTSYAFAGGANGVTTVKPFTINVKKGTELALNDILDLNKKTTKKLRSLITKAAKKDEELKKYLDEPSLEDCLKDIENLKWTFNKKGLTIHFSEYEIASGAAGTLKVHVPVKNLSSFINESIAKDLKITTENKGQEKITQKKRKLDPKGKYVALTFDDGPSGNVTPRILETLKKYDALATFFMLGSQVEYYPDIVKLIAKEGHEIANHSNSHPDLTKLSNKRIKKEIEGTNKKIFDLIGFEPTLVRPPYGAFDDKIKKYTKNQEMTIALWSVDTLDWKNRNPVAINQIVQRDVKPGSVILMHDIHNTTADALPQLLKNLSKDGYEFVTMSELMSLDKKAVAEEPFYGK